MEHKLELVDGFIIDDLSELAEAYLKTNRVPGKKSKEWLAKSIPNPKSKFGKDMIFMNQGSLPNHCWGVLGMLVKDDLIEYCKVVPRSHKYRWETRFVAKVIGITDEFLTIDILD